MSNPNPSDIEPCSGTSCSGATAEESSVPSRRSVEGALHVLGTDHETVLYHGDDVVSKPPVKEEEDESFYEVEVTLDDVKSMFKDLQRTREGLENAPFKGQKLRALEKEAAVLNSLHDHPNTAVRVRFPDRVVLQGIFRTSDTIGSVKSWLRQYLADSSLEFYLFTAPPRKVLEDDVKLVDEGLVAMVVVYFGSQSLPDSNHILKQDVYDRISDPTQAFELAKEKLKVRKRENQPDDEIKPSTETQVKDHTDQPSKSQQQPVRRSTDKGKVPKWFKMQTK